MMYDVTEDDTRTDDDDHSDVRTDEEVRTDYDVISQSDEGKSDFERYLKVNKNLKTYSQWSVMQAVVSLPTICSIAARLQCLRITTPDYTKLANQMPQCYSVIFYQYANEYKG